MPVTTAPPPLLNIFDDDDDGWQEMPIVRDDTLATDLDEEDRKKYHYQTPSTSKLKTPANATGNLIDVDDMGNEWRSKLDQNESEYTRLRMREEDEADEVHLRTRYLFDEDKAMTPLSQMRATKEMLTEAQRIAYVGLCALTAREMVQSLRTHNLKELKPSVGSMELWALKIMGRLYYHMELETPEQKMIESLAEHGVQAADLAPSLMTTHTVVNPEYDPAEALRRHHLERSKGPDHLGNDDDEVSISDQTLVEEPTDLPTPKPPQKDTPVPSTPTSSNTFEAAHTTSNPTQTTTKVLGHTTTHMPGVTTSLSSADKNVTLDIRWTVLCDLFLILIADSVFDARSRVLLENVAQKLGLGWLDVVKFENRVTEALEIQEDIEKLEQQEIVEGVQKAGKKRRYMMMGLATLGGGLVIGLSAGLLAPVIGVGLGAAFSAIGITGTGAFLGGTAGAAAITTGGVLTGSTIAARGMAKRTREVRTFDILPLHNNKRVNCILTVPGFMTGINDDVRLPFSVLDPIVGDVFSVLWEPEMIRETGGALKILTAEVLSQLGLTVLQATAMMALMSALQWPIILTKLGYLIDNPWNNALDRAKAAGRVLADVLVHRHLGVRPITLIGFSLGARVIFYALLELAKQRAFGIVQDVFLLGATLTASQSAWCQTRSVVSGRYVNAFAKNDWVLNYLFRATSGGVGTVAGLRPVQNVPGLENVEVTDKIAGHMSYRTFMPLILDQLGFPVYADHFDEPEEPDFTEDRIVVRESEQQKKKGWFSKKKGTPQPQRRVSRPPSVSSVQKLKSAKSASVDSVDGLPPRMPSSPPGNTGAGEDTPRSSSELASGEGPSSQLTSGTTTPITTTTPEEDVSVAHIPKHAGFDLEAMRKIIGQAEQNPSELAAPSSGTGSTDRTAGRFSPAPVLPERSHSTPLGGQGESMGTPLSVNSEPELENDFLRSVSLSDAPSSGPLGSPGVVRTGAMDKAPSASKLSFAAASDAPDWGAPSASSTNMRGADPYGFGGDSSMAYRSTPSLTTFQNPFAMSSHSLEGGGGGNEGISFGGTDGTITSASMRNGGFGADPWTVSGDLGMGKKTTPGFGSNPWS